MKKCVTSSKTSRAMDFFQSANIISQFTWKLFCSHINHTHTQFFRTIHRALKAIKQLELYPLFQLIISHHSFDVWRDPMNWIVSSLDNKRWINAREHLITLEQFWNSVRSEKISKYLIITWSLTQNELISFNFFKKKINFSFS